MHRLGGCWSVLQQKRRRFDALLGAAAIRDRYPSQAAKQLFENLSKRVDRDAGHPQRRYFDANFRLPKEISHAWTPPQSGRVNPNRVVTEALHCQDHGLRQATIHYICGPMRDAGSYHTAHALWALVLAQRSGCIQAEATCFSELQQELLEAQPNELKVKHTLDIDLYAERMLMLLNAGNSKANYQAWANNLMKLQQGDGSYGVHSEEEQLAYRYHATMITTWALALWHQQQTLLKARTKP